MRASVIASDRLAAAPQIFWHERASTSSLVDHRLPVARRNRPAWDGERRCHQGCRINRLQGGRTLCACWQHHAVLSWV